MKVRITDHRSYAEGVPDDPRFAKFPPNQETLDYFNRSDRTWVATHFTRVYMELESLDDLVALNNAYGPLGICRFQGPVGDNADDGVLEIRLEMDI